MSSNQIIIILFSGLFICVAAIALVTRKEINAGPFKFLNNGQKTILHRWSGWSAFGVLMVRSGIGLTGEDHLYPLTASYKSLHVLMSLACAAAILSKIWKKKWKHAENRTEGIAWLVILFCIGTFFVFSSFGLIASRNSYQFNHLEIDSQSIAALFTIAHASSAAVLIVTGRFALRSRNVFPQLRTALLKRISSI